MKSRLLLRLSKSLRGLLPPLLAAVGLVGLTPLLHSQAVPPLINYQGRVLAGGVLFDGSGQFKFALVNDAGSQVFWLSAPDTNSDGEPDAAVTLSVSKGLFNVALGDTALMAALDPAVLAHADVRLRVWFNDGAQGFEPLLPDQRLVSAPYALAAAGLTGPLPQAQLSGTYPNAVTFLNPANLFAGDGSGLLNVPATTLGGLDASAFWQLGGNAGATPDTHFLGTTDSQPLELRAANRRVLRLEAGDADNGPNIIGGDRVNSVTPGQHGSTISGGGHPLERNRITQSYATIGGGRRNHAEAIYSTVGGGYFNTSGGQHATVPGGLLNTAGGDFSFAAGRRAKALNLGSFVWADSADADFASTADNQFLIRASGGVGIGTASPATALDVNGTVRATALEVNGTVRATALEVNGTVRATHFQGDGSLLTGLNPAQLGGVDSSSFARLDLLQTFSAGHGMAAGQALEFGAGLQDKESNAGKIGYGLFTANALDIVGGGVFTNPRKIKFWAEGGATFTGRVTAPNATFTGPVTALSFVGSGTELSGVAQIAGATFTGPVAAPSFVGSGTELSGVAQISGAAFTGPVTAPSFVGSGAGLTGLTLPGVAKLGQVQTFTAPQRFGGSVIMDNGLSVSSSITSFGTLYFGNDPTCSIWGQFGDVAGASKMVIDAHGGVNIRTGDEVCTTLLGIETCTTPGVKLNPNGSAWLVLSDRNAKKDFTPVDGREILAKLDQVPMQRWHYKWENDGEPLNIGPMAQDFIPAFFPGASDKEISTLQFDGVALAAIQGLHDELKEKGAQIEQLQRDVAELKNLVRSLANQPNR